MPRRYYSSTAQRTQLAAPLSNSATTMIVAGTPGFPGTRPYTLIIDQDTINEEVVTVTAASGTTLTVTRGEDGTAAVAHDIGATVAHAFTARDLDEPNAHIAAENNVHGVTGDVVGTTDTQTLTGKSMSGADNTFTNIPQSAVTNLPGDLALKAPIDSPTFTGTVSLPSATSIGDVDATELSRVNGVTSNIQDQLDSKAPIANPTFTGTVSLPSTTSIGGVSSTEIAYLDGLAGNVQSQIDGITGGGVAVPPGGLTGYILVKKTDADYDMEWRSFASLAYVPGTSGDFVVTDGAITGGDSTGTYTSGTFTWRWHKFTTTGTTLQLAVSEAVIGDILIVGGGGGGGPRNFARAAGGGGAGAYYENLYAFGVGLHNVTVGAGGTPSGAGGDTRFDDIICYGGGTGLYAGPTAGGSGGGAAWGDGSPGVATGGSLDAGATSRTDVFRCSSGSGTTGGGAGGPGAGWSSSITGSPVTYAIGGAGGQQSGFNVGPAGAAETGSGGRGSGTDSGSAGGAGGSGIVVVRYRIA